MAGIVWGIHPPIAAPDREPVMPGKVSLSVGILSVMRAECTL